MSSTAARGPLSSLISQWAVVGLGAIGLYGNDEFSSSIWKGFQKLLIGTTFGNDFFKSSSSNIRLEPPSSQPIIIHNLSGRNEKWIGTLIQVVVGAGVLWGSFAVFSNFLPDAVKEMLPVTKRVFDTAVESLGNGIINLKDVLSQQILGLEAKQDEFSDKLDNAHEDILHIRSNVDDINDMVIRCEESLSIGEKRQKYTVRGMRLLLRCVGTILPANSAFNNELELFQYAGADLLGNDDDDSDKVCMTTPLKNSRLLTASNVTSNTPYSRMNSGSNDSVDGQSRENENPMMNATPSKFHHVDKMMDVIFTKSGKKLNYGVKVQ
jgi:hypothetical protein